MAAHPSIDPTEFLHEHLAQASPDLLRSLLTSMIDTLMSAEADAICGAPATANAATGANHSPGIEASRVPVPAAAVRPHIGPARAEPTPG